MMVFIDQMGVRRTQQKDTWLPLDTTRSDYLHVAPGVTLCR